VGLPPLRDRDELAKAYVDNETDTPGAGRTAPTSIPTGFMQGADVGEHHGPASNVLVPVT